MYQKKLETDIRSPLEYGMKLLAGKWRSRIVCLIGGMGSMRFGELKAELVNISDGVLASTLNELIALELVEKCSISERTALSEYRLTEKGSSIIPLLQQLCRWSGAYYKSKNGITMGHCRQCDFFRQWSEEIEESDPEK